MPESQSMIGKDRDPTTGRFVRIADPDQPDPARHAFNQLAGELYLLHDTVEQLMGVISKIQGLANQAAMNLAGVAAAGGVTAQAPVQRNGGAS